MYEKITTKLPKLMAKNGKVFRVDLRTKIAT
jgi:hypothetical protein